MSLFGLSPPSANVPGDVSPMGDYWYQPFATRTKSGQAVTLQDSLTVSAVYAATRLISETVGMLPIFIFRRTSAGKEPALDHPLFELLHDQPNQWQTAMEFKEMLTGHCVLMGNGYALIEPGPRGSVNSLTPLNPTRVEPTMNEEGGVDYIFTAPDGEKTTFPQGSIFHLKGFGDKLKGISVIGLARESIGLALATEEHGARYFSNGAEVGGVLKHPATLSEPAQERLKKSFDRKYAGATNHYRTLVLEEGMEWEQLGLSNEDSQFIASRQFQLGEIARWFRVPPHMLADLTRSSFNNIETQSMEFLKYSILSWLTRWTSVIRRDLIDAKRTYFADFKLEMLLKADIKSRYEAYKIAINNGIMNPNEVRLLENMNPREGGDEYWKPLNIGESGDPPPNNGSQATNLVVAEPPNISVTLPEMPDAKDVFTEELLPRLKDAIVNFRGMRLARGTATKVVEKEIAEIQVNALELSKDAAAWAQWVSTFYGRHAAYVSSAMCITKEKAKEYCDAQCTTLLTGGLGAMESWRKVRVIHLARLALEEGR